MHFKDYFSKTSAEYATYRPHYPEEMFQYLASVAPRHECAWDCATGNGQAAVALAPFFERVIATDGSASQLANATRHERVTYRQATAEESGIEPDSVDLVTVAQALHWLDRDAFFEEVKRVLRPGGVLAVWCYNLLEISAALDAVITAFYSDTVGAHWPFERSLVETGYRTIHFPFDELAPPRFYMRERWSLGALLGYLRTWSATQRFIQAHGYDPVETLADELYPLWGEPDEEKEVRWPLHLRLGRYDAGITSS